MGPKVGHQELEGIPGLSRKAGECCGPGLHNPLPLERPTTVNRCFYSGPLAKDHPFAGVSRFYGGVHHAQVAARSAYSPVHGVAVVDAQQVVAAATLGHVAVVGVGSGVEVVMAALGDHLVAHSVTDPLEEHLVVSCGNAGDGLALDHPSYHLGQGRAATHQSYEHHRHGYHRFLSTHLFLLPSGEGNRHSTCPPLSVTSVRILIAASGARRIPNSLVLLALIHRSAGQVCSLMIIFGML